MKKLSTILSCLSIDYPNGDVHEGKGVCTDVIISV
ncbi:MAG: DUF1287 domain-containing protein [Flavobacteriaceae bacterium]